MNNSPSNASVLETTAAVSAKLSKEAANAAAKASQNATVQAALAADAANKAQLSALAALKNIDSISGSINLIESVTATAVAASTSAQQTLNQINSEITTATNLVTQAQTTLNLVNNIIGTLSPLSEVLLLGVNFATGATSVNLANNYASVNNIKVHFDGGYQGVDQIISLIGNTLTFASPIPAGVKTIYVDGLGAITTNNIVPNGSIGIAQLGNDTKSYFVQSSNLAGSNGAFLVGTSNGKTLASNLIFDSIAALRLNTTPSTVVSTCTVSSYRGASNAPKGGVQGDYYVNINDTTSIDNNGSIIVDAAGNRWYILQNGLLRPDQFGADPTGIADSTAAFQTAINYLHNTSNGGILFILPGIYKLTSTLYTYANVRIEGSGVTNTVLLSSHNSDGIKSVYPINSSTASNVSINNFTLQNTSASNTGGGYVDICGSGLEVTRIHVLGFKYGLILDQTELATIRLNNVDGQLAGGAGIWLVNGADHTAAAQQGFTNRILIAENEINQGAATIGVAADGYIAQTIRDNNFNGCSTQIRLSSQYTCIIEGNEMEACSAYPISLNLTTLVGTAIQPSYNVTIRNNAISPFNGKPSILVNGTSTNVCVNLNIYDNSLAMGDGSPKIALGNNLVSYLYLNGNANLGGVVPMVSGSANQLFTYNYNNSANTLSFGQGTLASANNKTLTFNNSLTLAGTDGAVLTFPSTSATIARTDAAQSFTGLQTFASLTSTSGTINSLTASSINTSTATVGNGLLLTGPATLGATNNGTFSYESPNYRFYIGDGTGYSFRLSKRVGGVTTDQFVFNDNGNMTVAGSITAPAFYGVLNGTSASTAPTAPPGTNTTQIASTAFVTNAVNTLASSAVPASEVFAAGTGFTPGTSTSITLAGNYGTVNNIKVHFDGIYQGVNQLASLVGNTLTFVSPIPVGTRNVYVDGLGGVVVTSTVPASSVGVAQLASDALAYFVKSGTLSGSAGAAGIGFLQSGTGAGVRSLQDKGRDVINIRDFSGVDPTGATDSTAGIQAAITAAIGKTLYVPTGNYLLSTPTAGALLTINGSITIKADRGAFFLIGSAVSTSTDVILINPQTVADDGVVLDGLYVYEQSGAPARHIVNVKLNATQGLKEFKVRDCLFRTYNGYSIYANNVSGLNANGMFLTDIRNNQFYGGVNLLLLGDSNNIVDNVISGQGVGITFSLQAENAPAGATAKLQIQRNNITSAGGAIVGSHARGVTISDNNIEQTAQLNGGYSITLSYLDKVASGNNYGMMGVSVITRNKIEPTDPTSQCGAILLNNCNGTVVEYNDIGTSAILPSNGTTGICVQAGNKVNIKYNNVYISNNCIGVSIDSASKNTIYVPGIVTYYSSTLYTEIVDNGIGTKGVWKTLAPSAGWTNASASSTSLSYMKDEFNMVHLMGQIAPPSTTVAAGAVIASLPVGFWPNTNASISGNNRLPGMYQNSSTGLTLFTALRVIAAQGLQGQIWVADPLTNVQYFSLDGMCFSSSEV